jgi:YHS domain-containing protein
MTMKNPILKFAMCSIAALLFAQAGWAQEIKGVKCPVEGDAQVDAAASVDFHGGKVYFCCEHCADDFKSKMSDVNSELVTKAHHQLVLTGQFSQTACPLSGKPVAADKTADVGGVKVAFCCGGCQGAVQGLPDLASKAKKVFSNVSFEKGFSKAKQDPKLEDVKCFFMPKKDVKDDVFVEYGDHKVYFCCKSCVKRYEKNPSAYTTQANQHLVVTEQVKQTACPITGAATKDDQHTEVNGVKVHFCCGNCKGKVEKAEEKEKAELVFGKDAFAKGFK